MSFFPDWPVQRGRLAILPDASCILGAVKAGVVERPRLTGACDAFSIFLRPIKERSFALFLACQAAGLLFPFL
jgi:hypothetical protein